MGGLLLDKIAARLDWRRAAGTGIVAAVLMLALAAAPDARADEIDDLEAGYGSEAMDVADPLEPVNRVVFTVNDAIDIVVFRPVAITYRAVVPPPLRSSLANFLANAYSPVTFANDVLQGDLKRAETTMVRFFLNTVAGFGGIRDVAAEAGWERHTEDFGQTLAVWGFPSGPYIVAPILGPSTPRHLVGRAVDVLANPWTWILWDTSTLEASSPTLATMVSDRDAALEVLDNVRESSPDYYTTIKNLYWQNRVSEINNGEIVEEELPDIPDLR